MRKTPDNTSSMLKSSPRVESCSPRPINSRQHTHMKLLRYGRFGQERPGMLDEEGVIRDLSGHVADIAAETLAPAQLARLAKIPVRLLPAVGGEPRIGVPVKRIGKFIAVGLNY